MATTSTTDPNYDKRFYISGGIYVSDKNDKKIVPSGCTLILFFSPNIQLFMKYFNVETNNIYNESLQKNHVSIPIIYTEGSIIPNYKTLLVNQYNYNNKVYLYKSGVFKNKIPSFYNGDFENSYSKITPEFYKEAISGNIYNELSKNVTFKKEYSVYDIMLTFGKGIYYINGTVSYPLQITPIRQYLLDNNDILSA